MFIICGDCGAYHKLEWREKENKFAYHCGTVLWRVDPTTPVEKLSKTRYLLIRPTDPVLN
jgi:hypothetical protein